MTAKGQILLTLIAITAIFLSCSVNGETCTCESHFKWVKETFEENDAGYQYIIDKKGQAAYKIHNQLIRKNKNSQEFN